MVAAVWAQAPSSMRYLKARPYTPEEDSRILQLYEGIRVADAIDALDVVGLQGVTMMDRNIRPMWRDEQKFAHRIHGVALTIRLVPAQATAPKFESHLAERRWESEGWGPPPELQAEGANTKQGYGALIHPGTVLVVDNQAVDNGFCGSNNALTMFGKGLRGIVGNAVCRDNDELILTRTSRCIRIRCWRRGASTRGGCGWSRTTSRSWSGMRS